MLDSIAVNHSRLAMLSLHRLKENARDLRGVARGLQAFELKSSANKGLLIFLLKQAKHKVTFIVRLSKYKHSKGIHLKLSLFVFGHVQRARNILPRPLPFPHRKCGHASCPCFQVCLLITVYAILYRRSSMGSILHSAPYAVSSHFLT